MKLLINNEYQDVNFWSFLKCNILTTLVLGVIFYVAIFLLAILIGGLE